MGCGSGSVPFKHFVDCVVAKYTQCCKQRCSNVERCSEYVARAMLQSMKVIGGSIDVLEAIGRKTYDVLAEGEHGLKKTMVMSRENRPTLSQVQYAIVHILCAYISRCCEFDNCDKRKLFSALVMQSADGLSLLLARQPGTHCLTILETRALAETASANF